MTKLNIGSDHLTGFLRYDGDEPHSVTVLADGSRQTVTADTHHQVLRVTPEVARAVLDSSDRFTPVVDFDGEPQTKENSGEIRGVLGPREVRDDGLTEESLRTVDPETVADVRDADEERNITGIRSVDNDQQHGSADTDGPHPQAEPRVAPDDGRLLPAPDRDPKEQLDDAAGDEHNVADVRQPGDDRNQTGIRAADNDQQASSERGVTPVDEADAREPKPTNKRSARARSTDARKP